MLVMTSDGVLVEYNIRPHSPANLTKITDDSPIDVSVTAKFRWMLHRLLSWNERNLPLSPHHVMLEIEQEIKATNTTKIKETINGNSHFSKLPPRASSTATAEEENNHNNFTPRKYNSESDLFSAKTQQPLSRNNKFNANHNSGGARVPGIAMLQDKRFKTRTMQEKYQSDHELNDGFTDCDKTNGLICDVTENVLSHDSNLQKIEYDKEWLSQVEIVTYEGPARRLWMGPQFSFKTRQSTGSTMQVSSNSSALLSNRSTPIAWRRQHNSSSMSSDDTSPHSTSYNNMYVDDLDLNSLNIQNTRSDPVPTPYSADDAYADNSYSSMPMIEAGSGSFGQHGHMLEIGAYGSLEDKRYSSFDSDDKLRERLADAMVEQTINTVAFHKKSGSTSSIEFPPIDDELTHVTPFEFESNSLEMPSK